MLKLNQSSKFKKDHKLCIRQNYNLNLLKQTVDTLRIPVPLQKKDHGLSGNYAGCRECHILPDRLLIYRIDSNELYLIRT